MAYNELFAPVFVGQPYEGACYYHITRCPICAYTEKLCVSELMPLFCEPDEAITALLHGVLHREQTPASGGGRCDQFITGDREGSGKDQGRIREGSKRTAPRQAIA